MKIEKRIEIVCSTAAGLGSMSQKSANAILVALKSQFTQVDITIVNNSNDLQALGLKQPNLVFVGTKYVPDTVSGEKIWISEFLETHGILHTGSSQRAIEYELNKPLAKQHVLAAGVPTAKSMVIRRGLDFSDEEMTLQFPLFVKPASLGGGTGINAASHVYNVAELRKQVTFIFQNFATDALIEEYLPGREFSVALLKNLQTNELDAMPIELSVPSDLGGGSSVLSQALKTSNQEVVLSVTDTVLRSHIVDTATDAFNALGARDYGRIDIRLDEAGVAHFLEANLIPSLISGYGSFPKACVINQGMGYEAMILNIVNLAFDRQVNYSTEKFEQINGMLSPAAALI